MAKRVETASEIDEFKKLLLECGDTSFNCGDHRGPYDEYRVLEGKHRNAERACIEWVEKRVAVVSGSVFGLRDQLRRAKAREEG